MDLTVTKRMQKTVFKISEENQICFAKMVEAPGFILFKYKKRHFF
jgi:hypothetical protein